MNEEDKEEDGDNNDNNGKDNDEERHNESRGDKGSNNSRCMARLLAEICRGGEEHIPERSLADDPSSDKWQDMHMFPIEVVYGKCNYKQVTQQVKRMMQQVMTKQVSMMISLEQKDC